MLFLNKVCFFVGECVELTSRVKNLRQQTAEHERIVATQKSKIDKYSEVNIKMYFFGKLIDDQQRYSSSVLLKF